MVMKALKSWRTGLLKMIYMEEVNSHLKFISYKAKHLLGLQLLHQQMLLSCKKKPGMHTQDVKQVLYSSAAFSSYSYVSSRNCFDMSFYVVYNGTPCTTVIKCPYFTKFSLTIETIHKSDSGQSENVHNLSEEQLAARQVEVLDIASTARDYWSYAIGSNSTDFSTFKSKRTGRGPLLEGWQDRCNPVMTAYKLVTIDAPYWGFGYRLEQALLAGERALFLESHRNCFGWIDEWFGMTMPQIRQLERQSDSSLNQRIGKTTSKTTPEDFEQRFSCDEEIYSKSQEITDTRGL
ncbi:phosphatidylinositol transfer protein 1-like isoform X1 [Mangifera indica]|uniref:phosphatidylinositol transfer protein 1-like isoform X1 n=1 Tax=Mangifera indica TaxID=29780 RepID=UPI001CF9898F|nr:phosphatidylinositol transfer protein 1-like isoform X1 [Mangifera indica]